MTGSKADEADTSLISPEGEINLASVLQQFPVLSKLIRRVSASNNTHWNRQLLELLKKHGITDPIAQLSADGRLTQRQVRVALEVLTLVPLGNDPTTTFGGLFGAEARSAMTAAHSAEWSISMVKYATRLSDEGARALLKASASNALDVLREKPTHKRPTLGQLRQDSTAMVKKLIKLVMSKTNKTVVVICTGWLPDLVLQWGFRTATITYAATVHKQDGTNVLADRGVWHSEPDDYGNVLSRMLPAAYKGEAVMHVRLLEAGQVVRTFTACGLGHGGGSGAGQHAASVELDALGFARAVVGQTTMPDIDINIEDFGFINSEAPPSFRQPPAPAPPLPMSRPSMRPPRAAAARTNAAIAASLRVEAQTTRIGRIKKT